MQRLRVVLFALLAGWGVGCGDSSSGSKEEKPLPGKRIPGGEKK